MALWVPVAAYMAVIFYASSLSSVPGPVGGWVSDTFLHMTEYAVLALLTLRAFAGGRWAGVTTGALAAAWAVSAAYGVTDEWHQMHVPGRTSELRDLANDAIGAALALAAAGAWGIMRVAPRRE